LPVGKSTVAEIAAQALQWQVIEVDEAVRFASTYHPESSSSSSSSPPAVARPDVLDDILTHRRFEKIVVCDVTDLQHPSSRDLIQRFGSEVGPVVHVTRKRESVWHESLASGMVHEEDRDDWLRGWEACEEMCRSICSYEFVSLDCRVRREVASDDGDGGNGNGNGNSPPFKSIERDFTRLLRFIMGIDTNHIYVGPTAPQSYFLALTYDDVSLAIPHLDDLSIGIDCFEIRADLLKSYDLTFLAHQVAILRAATDLPILFTMRTHSQGGSFPDPRRDPAVAKRYNDVNKLAIKLGVEYLDVELFSPPGTIQEVMQIKGNTKIILSWHDWTGKVSWLGNEVKQIYEVACREGADVVKMIGWARSFQDNLNLRQFAQAVQQRGKVPLLAVNMGVEVSFCCFFFGGNVW
jgi:pentafunctional AROM polypeptide